MAVPANIISAAVGAGAFNRPADVHLVQKLLNAVPVSKGGPLPALAVDGQCGMKTCGAIQRFQHANVGFADGRIDPGKKTEQALLNLLSSLGVLAPLLAGAGVSGTAPQVPAQTSGGAGSSSPAGLSVLRSEIRKWALIGANGPYGDVGAGAPKGIVSDLDTVMEPQSWGGVRPVRRGWKNLKAFFDETVSGWNENNWKAPGYLDGVKLPGKRIPQPPTDGVSWCGIFATWCWRKAGKASKWSVGIGPTGGARVAGNQGIQPGDICVQAAKVHHFVAVDVNGDDIQGVNGNSDFQSILLKPVKRSTVIYYYRPE